MKDNAKISLTAKGILAAFSSAIVLVSYIVYFLYFWEDGKKLNELFFIGTTYGVGTFTGLLFTFFKNKHVKTLILFCSIFYWILLISYTINWIFFHKPCAELRIAMIIGLVSGLIYYAYDTFKNGRTISS